MKLKLLVFLLLAATCSFAQGRSPELLAKVNTKMEWHKKKAKRLFVRKLAWYYKNELKGKYGRDILKKLVLYPIDIRMRFPQRFTLDTGNIYNNLKKLRFARRRGVYIAYAAYNNELIGQLSTVAFTDKLAVDVQALYEEGDTSKAREQKIFDEFRTMDGYKDVVIQAGHRGFLIVLDKDGNVFTWSRYPGKWSPERLLTIEDSFREYNFEYNFRAWRFFFLKKYQIN